MIEENIPYLEQMSIFAALTPHELHMLAAKARMRRLKAGQLLCREGDLGNTFYIIAKGRLAVEKELADGSFGRLYTIEGEAVAGLVALIDGQPRSATIRAEQDSVVMEYPQADFERLYRAGSRFAFKLLDIIVGQLSDQLRNADQTLFDLTRDDDPDAALRAVLQRVFGPREEPPSSDEE